MTNISNPQIEDANTEDAIRPRLRIGFAIVILGLLIFSIGTKPNYFGWDRSPVVGFVQITVFLFGLALICLGGYMSMVALWQGRERSITSEIGSRIVATGYVISVFAGLADVFGMGSQAFPQAPYFGPWQSTGVLIGQIFIALGFLLFIPYSKK
ncbi:MAG: hypothetical protein Fur002_09540 [Anaerolineales bacterium]